MLQRDIRGMCSKRINSVLHNKSAAILRQFTWDSLMKELAQHAPTLLHVLKGCTLTSRKKENQDATICLCAAILLRFRNRNMNLLQRILSLILYAGHSAKLVCPSCVC